MKNSIKLGVALALCAGLMVGCGKKPPDPQTSLADGKAALQANDYKKALIQLKNVVQAQPDNGEARFLLAEAYHAIRDLASARKEFERAYELGYNRDTVALRLAELMQESGDTKLFIDKFSEYQSQNVEVQSEILAQVARARMTLGDLDGARKDYQKALSINPKEKLARLGLIRLQAAGGDPTGAVKAMDQLIEQHPDYALAWIGKSELLRGYSDIGGSIAAMERAAQLRPNDLTIFANLTSMYINMGRGEQADKALETLRAKAPPGLPALHYLTALRAYQKGNLVQAQESIAIALKMQQDAIPFVLLAATIESAAGNYEQAEKHANFVMARSPDKAYARTLLASSYIRAQRGAQAMEILEPLLKDTNNKYASVYALAGEASALLQDLKSAERYFDQAAKLAPNDPAQRARLAITRLGLGDNERALADLESTVRADNPTQYSEILLAMTYLRQRQYDKALAAIDAMEKKQPDNVLVHNLRASAYLGKRDLTGARAALEKGLKSKPNSVSLTQNLARIDLLEGKKEAAAARFEDFIKRNPTDWLALVSYAEMKEQLGAPTAEVLPLYERAVASPTHSVRAPMQLANFYMRLGDSTKALATLRDASQKSPEDATLMTRYGQMQIQQKDGPGAVSTFSKLTKQQPHIANGWIQLAEAYLVSKNESGAIQSLNRALEIKPTPPLAKAMLAQINYKQGNKEEARRIAAELSRDHPKLPVGAMVSADIAVADKDWDGAARSLRTALAISPRDGMIAARLHYALLQGGKTADASAFSTKFRQDFPGDTTFLTYLADSELRGGRCAQAVPFYRQVGERNPNNVLVLNNLAWCLHEMKDSSALSIAERALKIAPRAPAVMDTVGIILSANGQHERATKLLQDASIAAPQNAEMKFHLAQAYAKAGNKDKAKFEADAASKLPAPESLMTKIKQFQLSL